MPNKYNDNFETGKARWTMLRLAFVVLVKVVSGISADTADLCDPDISLDISNGSIVGNKIIHNGIIYDESEYYESNENSAKLGCVCLKRTCLRKCCPLTFAYEPKRRECIPWDAPFDPPLFDEYRNRLRGVHATNETFNFVFGLLDCKRWNGSIRFRASRTTEQFHLRTVRFIFCYTVYV